MKNFIIFAVLAVLFGGCSQPRDIALGVRNKQIAFFDGVKQNNAVRYYQIKNSKLYLGNKLLGEFRGFYDSGRFVTDENDRQSYKFNGKNKILKLYVYEVESTGEELSAAGVKMDLPKAKERVRGYSSFRIDEVVSQNGICKDFNANLPLLKKVGINYYHPNGKIAMIVRYSYKFSKSGPQNFGDNMVQVDFDVSKGDEVYARQKESIEMIRRQFSSLCAEE